MFEPAAVDDAEALVALRDGIARWLLERGVDQWLPGEFPQQRMRSWIERGHIHRLGRGSQGQPSAALHDRLSRSRASAGAVSKTMPCMPRAAAAST